MSALWSADALRATLDAQCPGMAVEVAPAIDSTNAELMRRARAGRHAPVLLVAERQHAGRGRLGREWHDGGDGASLTFSLGLPLAPRDWSGLSLAVGVSVARSLDPDARIPIALKWPNDLWVHDHKLGGILIETALSANAQDAGAPRYLVIGMGLNIGPREATGLRTPPAWLRQWRPEATAPEALHAVAPALLADVLRFARTGFAAFADAFAARDALRGRDVQTSDGIIGCCQGVDAGGELLVHTAAGMKSITSSEISVRPVSAAGSMKKDAP